MCYLKVLFISVVLCNISDKDLLVLVVVFSLIARSHVQLMVVELQEKNVSSIEHRVHV